MASRTAASTPRDRQVAAFACDFSIENAKGADTRRTMRTTSRVLGDDLFLRQRNPRLVERAEVIDAGVVGLAVEAPQFWPVSEKGDAEHLGVTAIESLHQ